MQSLLESAFVAPLVRLGEQFGRMLTPLVVVLMMLIVGAAVAHLVRRVVYWLLNLLHFNSLVDRTGLASAIMRTRVFTSPADFAARVAQGFIWLVIILMALHSADTQVTETLIVRFVNYIPDVITALLVLLLGAVISNFLARSTLLALVNAQWAGARLLAGIVKTLVMLLATVIALEQLRIGQSAILIAFAILFGGIVVAVAIAFGLGARDLAKEWLQEKIKPREPDEEVFHHL